MTAKRSILITGASTGIGLETAHFLRECGWDVYVTARKDADLQRLRDLCFPAIYMDMHDSASIAAGVDWLLNETQGKLTAVFLNAGYGQPGAVESLPRAAWERQFSANVFGPMELLRALLPVFRASKGGRILINSSILGYTALPLRACYSATKASLEMIADTLRLELTGTNIHVSLIEPGPIEARFRANSLLAFREHITVDGSAYQEAYQRMVERLSIEGKAVPFTLPAIEVAKVVARAINSKRPRYRYQVTVPAKLFRVLNWLLPTALLDRMKREKV